MKLLRTAIILLVAAYAYAVPPDQKHLPIGLAPHEKNLSVRRQSATAPPVGEVRSLAEWDESDAVMTLWSNSSLLGELSKRGNVKLLADTSSDVQWWKDYIADHNLPADKFSYFVVPTDSMWVRDYGPWFILDGNRNFGVVDNNYNRPRPNDDVVPRFISQTLNVPFFHTGLTHTGGNFYNDNQGAGFSSTLVYTENKSLTKDQINARMKSFLGIERYTTSPLGVKVTIEHLDTFGKLVAPDTWVFAEFATSSRFYNDAENMVAKLKAQKSPYGTPYKIYRLKMVSLGGADSFRAYLNSFISNGALYFPTYGNDQSDKYARDVYQQALPGYEIVGVDNGGTEWGDSVHCRNRNLLKKDTLFIFPTVADFGSEGHGPFQISAEVVTVGADLVDSPQLNWSWNGVVMPPVMMNAAGPARQYTAQLPEQAASGKLSFYISAKDSLGRSKSAPLLAEKHPIIVEIPN